MPVPPRAIRVAESLGTLLVGLPQAERPRFLALLERRAADRYDAWAEAAGSPADAAGLRACADRERTIAERVERLCATAPAEGSRYEPLIAEISSVYLGAFEGATPTEGYAVQAALERSGAAAWRAFAAGDPAGRDVFLACATLEEDSATFLEQLCASTPR